MPEERVSLDLERVSLGLPREGGRGLGKGVGSLSTISGSCGVLSSVKVFVLQDLVLNVDIFGSYGGFEPDLGQP